MMNNLMAIAVLNHRRRDRSWPSTSTSTSSYQIRLPHTNCDTWHDLLTFILMKFDLVSMCLHYVIVGFVCFQKEILFLQTFYNLFFRFLVFLTQTLQDTYSIIWIHLFCHHLFFLWSIFPHLHIVSVGIDLQKWLFHFHSRK